MGAAFVGNIQQAAPITPNAKKRDADRGHREYHCKQQEWSRTQAAHMTWRYFSIADSSEYFVTAALLADALILPSLDCSLRMVSIVFSKASGSPGGVTHPTFSSSTTRASSDPGSVSARIGFPAARML